MQNYFPLVRTHYGRDFGKRFTFEYVPAYTPTGENGFVSGEDLIFNETLLFNVSCGKEINLERLVEYCKVLNFYDFVQSKTDQFNYMIHENGRNLSRGQRRKVLLLRALLSGAEIILLDEIFNGMDIKSKERAEFLIDFIEDKTFIIVSHLPTERIRFDRQFELKKGVLKGV